MRRIALFVDGSNFKSACNAAGFRPDYIKLKKYFEDQGDLVGAYYFTALPPEHVNADIRRVTDFLQYNGWQLVTKETKTITNERGVVKMKGNMDIEIVVRAFRMCEYVSDLVLCSGDGDFVSAVEELQARGLRVTAVSYLAQGETNMTADELRRQVSTFINVKDLVSVISLDYDEPKPGLKFLHTKETDS